jgi:iron complex transport system substrate-binding protein
MIARVALAALSLAGSCLIFAQPAESLRDDEGRPASLGTPAVRVVTLAPSLTELVFAAGAGDKLVGLSAYSDYPSEARGLPQVADAAGIAWESLLALKPDLVLAWKGGTRPADIARLNGLDVNVFVIEIKKLADVSRALRSIGKLVGRPGPAESAAGIFQRELATLRDANTGKSVVRLFVEISSKPLMTVNRDHVISEMIRLCRGVNVFDDMPSLVSEPSREELLARAPDAILFGRSSSDKRIADVPAYAGLRAVRDGKIYGVTSDYAFRPGPRLILAAREICDALDRSRVATKAEVVR